MRRHDDDNDGGNQVATTSIPIDEFSGALRGLGKHPEGVTKQSVVDLQDFYGNSVTWVIKTIRVDGEDTVFLQRQDAQGGKRLVLPPQVTAALARHRDGAATANRRRVGRTTAANRAAQGIKPAFLRKESA